MQPTVDVSGIAVGSAVSHKAFGKGTVKSITGGMITVVFESFKGEKKFQFPTAFQQGFLRKEE